VITTNARQEQFGIVLRLVTEPVDTATHAGQTLFAILAGMAAQERQSIIQRTIAGKKEKAKKGGFAGGSAPYGYERDKEGGLVIDEQEAAVVRRIAAMRESGATLQAIADALNAEGIPTKRSGSWHPRIVSCILDSPRYRASTSITSASTENSMFSWRGSNNPSCQKGVRHFNAPPPLNSTSMCMYWFDYQT